VHDFIILQDSETKNQLDSSVANSITTVHVLSKIEDLNCMNFEYSFAYRRLDVDCIVTKCSWLSMRLASFIGACCIESKVSS